MMYSNRRQFLVVIFFVLLITTAATGFAQGVDMHGAVDSLLAKYKAAGQTWTSTIEQAATNLFWLLATISLAWTCISMGIKQADLVEIVAELCRYIMFTGLFLWLLTNGATFANNIVETLRQVGGDAAGTGQSVYPGDLITVGMQVYQQTLQHVNFLQPESIVAPIMIAVIILIVCALIAVNMILLLCAAWIVLYAGLIFLGFGGCRWTSDMAINYYRTVLGIGVSLMTMELIIGIGVQFLQQLVASTSSGLDAGALGILLCATIILAVISHRLPHMVAGMVLGGGNNGAIGGIGVMNVFAGAMMGASLAGRMGGNPAAVLATEGVGEGAKMLQERIAAAEAAMGNQQSRASMGGDSSDAWGGAIAGSLTDTPSTTGGSAAARGGQSRRGGATSGFGGSSIGKPAGASAPGDHIENGVREAEPPEPPLERPMSPDEQRGFGPDGNGGSDDQPYTPRGDDE
jgi:type IV secretion system protein TrbL